MIKPISAIEKVEVSSVFTLLIISLSFILMILILSTKMLITSPFKSAIEVKIL